MQELRFSSNNLKSLSDSLQLQNTLSNVVVEKTIGTTLSFLYFKGIFKEETCIIKENLDSNLITAFYSQNAFYLLPSDDQGCIPIDNYEYYSNVLVEETLYFNHGENVAFFMFAFSNKSLEKFQSDQIVKVLEFQPKEFLLFNPLKGSVWQKIQTLVKAEELLQYSIIYELMHNYITLFFQRFTLELSPRKYSFNDISRVFRVKKYLELKYDTKCQPVDLENVAGFGYSKLRKLFKEVFGMSITQYTNDYKLRLAYEWLETGSHNVSDCTYGLGFISVTHFGRMFKEKFEVPPSNVYKFTTKKRTTSEK